MNYREILMDYLRQRDRGWILSLFAVVCLIYLPFLGNPLVFDDLAFFTTAALESYLTSTFQFGPRWLPFASFSWTNEIFSNVIPHFFRLGNVLLHAINAILLFYLLRHLIAAVISELKNSKVIVWGAWYGAIFFAASPVAVYATGYLIQRTILMATLFALIMQLAYVRGLLTGQKKWLLLSVAAYFLAAFSKEHGVMAIAVLAAITVLLRDKTRVNTRSLWLVWGAFITVGLLVILSSNGVIGKPYEPMAAEIFTQQKITASTPLLHLLSVLTQAGLYFKYLMLWLLPNPAWMSVDMRETFVPSLTAWQGWLGATSFVAYGVVAIRLLLRPRWQGLVGLALLYPWLQFIVEFSTIRVQEPFVLYRSYLWMPGLALFIPLLLAKFPGPRTILALSCIALLLVPLSWNRLWIFGDNYRLWNDAAVIMPNEQVAGADRVLYNRGYAAMAKSKWNEAVEDMQKVVALSPQLAPVHKGLGSAYFNAGRYQEAIAQYDEAISLDQDDADVYFGKGLALKRLHEDEKAMQQMIKACELKNLMACMIVRGLKGKSQ